VEYSVPSLSQEEQKERAGTARGGPSAALSLPSLRLMPCSKQLGNPSDFSAFYTTRNFKKLDPTRENRFEQSSN
jgi:hypothetical protein